MFLHSLLNFFHKSKKPQVNDEGSSKMTFIPCNPSILQCLKILIIFTEQNHKPLAF